MPKLHYIITVAATLGALLAPATFSGQLPTAADVDNLSRLSAAAFDAFITETFLPRRQLEYSGRFIDPQDANNISASAETAATALTAILKSQETVRQKIELYEGDDWDELYGKTSLWRTSVAAARQTRWRICIVDYHHAIASPGKKKQAMLKKVIDQTGKDSKFSTNGKKLLNIRASWAISPEKNTENTIRRLDSLIASSGIDNEIFYQAIIMRMKLSRQINAQQIKALADSLRKSKLKNNFKLLYTLAIEELKAGSDNIIYSIASQHPAILDFTSRIILKDIAANASDPKLLVKTLKNKTPAEISLAAFEAISEKDSKYAAVFKQCCQIEKFQCVPVYLAAAECCRKTEPLKALDYYLQAAQKSKTRKDKRDKISIVQIARRRATLAYELYYKNSKYSETAKEALQLYLQEAANDKDEDKTEYQELAYLYASMAIGSGNNEKALKLLKSIASSAGKYADEATLDLMFYDMKNSHPRSPQRKELIVKLKNFIDKLKPKKNNRPGVEKPAIRLYCKLLIEEGGKKNATTVLKILEKMPSLQSIDITILKAAALAESGDLVNAAETLSAIAGGDNSKGAALAAAIVAEIIEDIDQYEDKVEDFDAFIKKCLKLAHFAARSITGEDQVDQIEKRYIEISIIETRKGSQRIAAVQSLLNDRARGKDNDIDWMRCRARLYMKQDQYTKAFTIWSSIAQARKPRSRSADKPQKWWRAKYYALKSYSKIPNPKNNDLKRAIEILISTNKNIPQFWKKKLMNLKNSN
ncbi:MAG: hypothetical protein FVQ82_11715 [Planctomycetes bacterium]|nr:hypothetical protein [Planctomycetota bacterium]